MKDFIDTHDKTKGSFPTQVLTDAQLFDQFDTLDRATADMRGSHKAHDHRAESSLATLAKLHDQGAVSSIAILAELVA